MHNDIRKIIHIDMDAFFAAVEQKDHQEYKDKPLIVGGRPEARGVVSTCSYEARKFGVHSAMPTKQALQKCPDAILIEPRIERYKEISLQIRSVFYEYTDLVEPMSLDEAYLDVTENKKDNPSATWIAKEIKQKIFEKTGLTSSAGISFNKFLAKMASDIQKPDGLTVITPKEADSFIESLKIKDFHGVGPATEKKMHDIGIFTGKDLKKWNKPDLIKHFGKAGSYYYDIAQGIDDRPVEPNRERKSIGAEYTFPEDVDDINIILQTAGKLMDEVLSGLDNMSKQGKTLTIKVKYSNFQSITRSKTASMPITGKDVIMGLIQELIKKTEIGERKVRLFGISIAKLEKKGQ